jgi:hypothetical protein
MQGKRRDREPFNVILSGLCGDLHTNNLLTCHWVLVRGQAMSLRNLEQEYHGTMSDLVVWSDMMQHACHMPLAHVCTMGCPQVGKKGLARVR